MPLPNLTTEQKNELLSVLQTRFEKHPERHAGIGWDDVAKRLDKNPAALVTLYTMEKSEGEPDVVAYDPEKDVVVFFDCSPESPKGRRSLCYDQAAWLSRKEFKPASSAMEMAEEIGVQLLDEPQYRYLQTLGKFDQKTSSWLKTPDAIRRHGGAIFGDRRYEHVFFYHNGAESYYAARGFRGWIEV